MNPKHVLFFFFHTGIDTELFTLYLKVASMFLMMPLFHIIKSNLFVESTCTEQISQTGEIIPVDNCLHPLT